MLKKNESVITSCMFSTHFCEHVRDASSSLIQTFTLPIPRQINMGQRSRSLWHYVNPTVVNVTKRKTVRDISNTWLKHPFDFKDKTNPDGSWCLFCSSESKVSNFGFMCWQTTEVKHCSLKANWQLAMFPTRLPVKKTNTYCCCVYLSHLNDNIKCNTFVKQNRFFCCWCFQREYSVSKH